MASSMPSDSTPGWLIPPDVGGSWYFARRLAAIMPARPSLRGLFVKCRACAPATLRAGLQPIDASSVRIEEIGGPKHPAVLGDTEDRVGVAEVRRSDGNGFAAAERQIESKGSLPLGNSPLDFYA